LNIDYRAARCLAGLAIGWRLGPAAWEPMWKLENNYQTRGSFRIPATSLGIVAAGE
jgi:hypothetical protein